MTRLGGIASQINPLIPSELVIDHSVQVDVFGRPDALDLNGKIEFDRNKERYGFLRWGQKAFDNFKVVPPNTGIVHQVNLENLARVVMEREIDGVRYAFPDTVFGTDSHTTMINGIGVLGWGVGGIEAEAAMLGQPSSMLIPQVVGFKLTGDLPEGATATDLVLTVTQMLRSLGVVGKFVEFYGDGLNYLPLADRATIANMAPEYGATCGIFPIDDETLRYMDTTGRPAETIALTEAYAKATIGYERNDVTVSVPRLFFGYATGLLDLQRPQAAGRIAKFEEPVIKAVILTPSAHVGGILELCQEKRGIQKGLEYLSTDRVLVTYDMPFNEVVLDFYDRLKTISRGYASLDYHVTGYWQSPLVKLDILVNGDPVDALSIIVHRDAAYERGRALASKMRELIPRQMFEVAIQAAIGGRIIARGNGETDITVRAGAISWEA